MLSSLHICHCCKNVLFCKSISFQDNIQFTTNFSLLNSVLIDQLAKYQPCIYLTFLQIIISLSDINQIYDNASFQVFELSFITITSSAFI